MSQKNSEIALQQIDALNRGDVDAFVDLVSPDVEWEDAMFWSEPMRIHRGKTELGEWLNQVLEPWESFHIEVEEIREAADDRVSLGGSLQHAAKAAVRRPRPEAVSSIGSRTARSRRSHGRGWV